MQKKKHTESLQEFLEHKKIELGNPKIKRVDWEKRKTEWIKAVHSLYDKVDEIIVKNFRNAGYKVTGEKEEIRIVEDYVGPYNVPNYILKVDKFKIYFSPIGTIWVGFKGRVDMTLPKGTVELILTDNNVWKILEGFTVSVDPIDFNEENIMKVFRDYL